jgi:hypothetical protein
MCRSWSNARARPASDVLGQRIRIKSAFEYLNSLGKSNVSITGFHITNTIAAVVAVAAFVVGYAMGAEEAEEQAKKQAAEKAATERRERSYYEEPDYESDAEKASARAFWQACKDAKEKL